MELAIPVEVGELSATLAAAPAPDGVETPSHAAMRTAYRLPVISFAGDYDRPTICAAVGSLVKPLVGRAILPS
jgi:hypothetical protein